MRIHTITSKKQDNGLWGTPLKLNRMEMKGIFPSFEKQQLISAITIKFSEMYDVNFSCFIGETSMTISHGGDYNIDSGNHKLPYDDYRVVDDKLFYLETDDDKIVFTRMMKLKNIKNKINVDS